MRLLNATTKRFTEFFDATPPRYAILSHTWGDEEVMLQDIQKLHEDGENHPSTHPVALKAGYRKIEGCCDLARRDGFDWVWVDTCCIDKSSSAELSEAINSMFRWYKESAVCYVYLADVSPGAGSWEDPDSMFRRSRWFTRGWTLQELLAPRIVQFFNVSWNYIGQLTTNSHSAFADIVSDITAIPAAFLEGLEPRWASIAQRMSWASRRDTTRTEDIAYCMLGIFDINLPLLYGEGKKAFQRLQEEIVKISNDQTILAWGFGATDDSESTSEAPGVFADSPKCFSGCASLVPFRETLPDFKMTYQLLGMTNDGLRLRLPFLEPHLNATDVYGVLNCHDVSDPTCRIGIPLAVVSRFGLASRIFGLIGDDAVLKRRNASLVSHFDFAKEEANFRAVYILRTNEVTGATPQGDCTFKLPKLSVIPPLGFTYRVLYMDPSLEILERFYKTPTLLVDAVDEIPPSTGEQKRSRLLLHLQQGTPKDPSEEFVALIEYMPNSVRCSIGEYSPDLITTVESLEHIHEHVSGTKLRLADKVIKAQRHEEGGLHIVKIIASCPDGRKRAISSALCGLRLGFRLILGYAVSFLVAIGIRLLGIIILCYAVSYLRGEFHGSISRACFIALGASFLFKPQDPVTGLIARDLLEVYYLLLLLLVGFLARTRGF
jgi:hypothetical protein